MDKPMPAATILVKAYKCIYCGLLRSTEVFFCPNKCKIYSIKKWWQFWK